MEFNFTGIPSGSQTGANPVEEMVVLGAGPAGWSAALYAARGEIRPLVLTGMEPGGQAALTHTIENYPGFPEGIGGSKLGELFQQQAERFGTRTEYDTAIEVNLNVRPFVIKTYGAEHRAKTLVIATGATPNHLKVPGEDRLIGKGVSYCATCDGWFFKDREVVVVGGGDSALEEGIFLTRYASQVTIVHRRDTLRAGAILQSRAQANPKIRFIWNTVVTEVLGEEALTGLALKNVVTGETSQFATQGLFIFIGHQPNTSLFKGQVKMDEGGYIETDKRMQTSVPGVYAAGEAADPIYRQVITSAGMGAAAAMQALKYLEDHE